MKIALLSGIGGRGVAIILLTTRGLGVYLPPELYESRPRALLEVEHLTRRIASRSSALPAELPVVVRAGNDLVIHAVELDVPAMWLETSLWLVVECHEGVAPTLSLLGGQDPEALEALRARVGTTPASHLAASFHEATVLRQGEEIYVGVHHLKRVGNL